MSVLFNNSPGIAAASQEDVKGVPGQRESLPLCLLGVIIRP